MLKRIVLVISIIILATLIFMKFQDKSAIQISKNTSSGIIFLDGIYQPNPPICLIPEEGKSYNIALVQDGSRQNIQIIKNTNIQISPSEGDDLGLSVKLISQKDPICHI